MIPLDKHIPFPKKPYKSIAELYIKKLDKYIESLKAMTPEEFMLLEVPQEKEK